MDGSGVTVGEMAETVRVQEGKSVPIGMCPSIGVGGEALLGGYSSSSRWVFRLDYLPSHGLAHETKLISRYICPFVADYMDSYQTTWSLQISSLQPVKSCVSQSTTTPTCSG